MRQENIAMLQDTLDILEQGYYRLDGKKVKLKLSKEEMRETDVYLPGEIQAIGESGEFPHDHHAGRLVTSEYSDLGDTTVRSFRNRHSGIKETAISVLETNHIVP